MGDDLSFVCAAMLDANPDLLNGQLEGPEGPAAPGDSDSASSAGDAPSATDDEGAEDSDSASAAPPPGSKTIEWPRHAANHGGGAGDTLSTTVGKLCEACSVATTGINGEENWIQGAPGLDCCDAAMDLAAKVTSKPAAAGRVKSAGIAEMKLSLLDQMLGLLELEPKNPELSGAEFVAAWVESSGDVCSVWCAPIAPAASNHPAPASAPAAAPPRDILAIEGKVTADEVSKALQQLPEKLLIDGAVPMLEMPPPPTLPSVLQPIPVRVSKGTDVRFALFAQPGVPLSSTPVKLRAASNLAGKIVAVVMPSKRSGAAKQAGSGLLKLKNGAADKLIVCGFPHFTPQHIVEAIHGEGVLDLGSARQLIDLINVSLDPTDYKRDALGLTLLELVDRVASAIKAPGDGLVEPTFTKQITAPEAVAAAFVGAVVQAIPAPFMVPPVVEAINRLLERLVKAYTVVCGVIVGAMFQTQILSIGTVTEAPMPATVSAEQKRIEALCLQVLAAAGTPGHDDVEAFEAALGFEDGAGEPVLDALADKAIGDPTFAPAMLSMLVERWLVTTMDCNGVPVLNMVKACELARSTGAWIPVLTLLVSKPDDTPPGDIMEALLRLLDGDGNALACPEVLAAIAAATATDRGVAKLHTELNTAARLGVDKHLPAIQEKAQEIEAARKKRAESKARKKEHDAVAGEKRKALRSGDDTGRRMRSRTK